MPNIMPDVSAVVNQDGTVDLTCKQGATWDFVFIKNNANGSPMDLHLWGIRGQIRKHQSSVDSVATWTLIDTQMNIGIAHLQILPAVNAAIPVGKSLNDNTYVYDLERYLLADTTTVMKDLPSGKLIVIPAVTKDVGQ